MNFTSESVMHDIEVALRQRSQENWSNTDRLLLKAQIHIASLQRQLDYKELTDEEILEICNQFEEADMPVNGDSEWSIPSGDYLYFARAILRKAQEK